MYADRLNIVDDELINQLIVIVERLLIDFWPEREYSGPGDRKAIMLELIKKKS